jgi:hypothetical protein
METLTTMDNTAKTIEDKTIIIINENKRLGDNWNDLTAIKSQADYDFVVDLLKKLKGAAKEVEQARKDMVSPLNERVKAINTEHNDFRDFVKNIESRGKKLMGDWDEAKERKLREEQAEADRKARKEAEKLEERAEKEAEKGNLEKADALQQNAEAVTQTTVATPEKTEGVGSGVSFVPVITNPKEFIKAAASNPFLFPCLEINESALKTMVKQMGEDFEAPGVRVEKKRNYSVRTG